MVFLLKLLFEKVTQPQLTDAQRTLNALAGVNLSPVEARETLPRVRDHKWYLSEYLGRDVGWHVAAVDYFENIAARRPPESFRVNRETPTPRLPMMRPLSRSL
ncbi:MAG TPA: DUF4032 domain-containing protein [Pyrinomonadaceae bacterium]|nr:DUF4032 domain-containing protein [Pyrinomonadaceae bacterium]